MLGGPLLLAVLQCSGWVITSPSARYSTADNPGYYNSANAQQWRGPSSFRLDTVAIRWGHTPPATTGSVLNAGVNEPAEYAPTTSGLSGGITFAIHRDLCRRMLHLFPEENPTGNAQETTFLTCEELRDVIKRALDTWAVNHRTIYFRDVSDQCADVNTTSGCAYAEIFIVASIEGAPGTSTNSNQAALAVTSHRAGRVYTTAGERMAVGFEISGAVIHVRAPASAGELCWYLDSTFCWYFHMWQGEDVDVVLIARIVCGVLFCLAVLYVLYLGLMSLTAACCLPKGTDESEIGELDAASRTSMRERKAQHEPARAASPPPSPPAGSSSPLSSISISPPPSPPAGPPSNLMFTMKPARLATAAGSPSKNLELSKTFRNLLSGLNQGGSSMAVNSHGSEEHLTCGSRRCTAVMEYVSVMPTIPLLLAIFFIIFAPMFYYRIFTPCWECHGFESAIAHEVGHVLGFHHPDVESRHNLKANQRMNATTCSYPLDHVRLAATTVEVVTESIMFSRSLHRVRTCLSVDDLEGLNFLYAIAAEDCDRLPSSSGTRSSLSDPDCP